MSMTTGVCYIYFITSVQLTSLIQIKCFDSTYGADEYDRSISEAIKITK